jgi:hypothetical protein
LATTRSRRQQAIRRDKASRDMVLDYSEFAINAKLDEIEALPKPSC